VAVLVGNNPPMSVRSALVVGAGIAGSTLAYWLTRHGIETTVVERAETQRSSGSPVDVRGPALAVVEQMNLLGRVCRILGVGCDRSSSCRIVMI
jgi:2-polyprenyl-6-methoxyphenol hydroxylase-like FAD-dependent oxidoreductase